MPVHKKRSIVWHQDATQLQVVVIRNLFSQFKQGANVQHGTEKQRDEQQNIVPFEGGHSSSGGWKKAKTRHL